MISIDTHGLKVFKLVKFIEVEAFTSIGWRLLGTVNRSSIATVFEHEPVPILSTNNGTYTPPQTTSVNRHHVVDDPLFLLGKDDESALAAMKSKVDACQLTLAEHAKCAEEMRKAKASVDRLTELVDERLNDLALQRKSTFEAIDGSRKMERDIAKLRVALGEVRMREILGS